MNTSTPDRRVFSTMLALTAMALATPGATATTPVTDRRAIELTFLKANPGQRDQLKTFIVLNWFAMDKIAKEQGLMRAFTVMDTGTDEGTWNVLVSVTYMNDKGYDGIVEQFEKIRKAHKTIQVEGKTLRDLGTIVESKRVFENPAHATT
jgi:hypothetical protein